MLESVFLLGTSYGFPLLFQPSVLEFVQSPGRQCEFEKPTYQRKNLQEEISAFRVTYFL